MGLDPGFRYVGIVALDSRKGDVPVEAFTLRYERAEGDVATHDTWYDIGYETRESLQDIKADRSPRQAMTIGMMAPFSKGKSEFRAPIKSHVAAGIIFGHCMNFGIATMARDLKVRRALGPLIGCPLSFKPEGEKTIFVKKFWKECPNVHCADAWLMAKYLLL